MAKLKKTFRMDEDTLNELVKLADRWGVSQAAAVERAVQAAAQTSDKEQAVDSRVMDTLTRQLEVKDEQIAELGRALHAAQVLQAQNTTALESAEQKQSRLARIRAALFG